jgi:phage terminase small subunit
MAWSPSCRRPHPMRYPIWGYQHLSVSPVPDIQVSFACVPSIQSSLGLIMPRIAKSVEQHKIDGTYRPDRHSERLVLPNESPQPPSDLDASERELWLHITDSIPVAKVDALALRCLVESWRLYRRAYGDFVADPNKETRITWKACQDAFLAVARQFGCTPVSRSQVKAPEPQQDAGDPFQDILRRMANG